jgi:tetratricopeptide (TPR) repeat protein
MNKKIALLLLLIAVVVGSYSLSYAKRNPSLLCNDSVFTAKKLIDSANGNQEKLGEASDLLRKTLLENPENQYAVFLQARAMQQRGMLDQALESYQKYLELKLSSDYASNYNSAELFEAKGDLANAEKYFQACIALAPGVPSGWERMIALQLKAGRAEKAKEYFNALKASLPNSELVKKLSPLIPQ